MLHDIIRQPVFIDGQPVLAQLCLDDRCERILDPAFKHLSARRDYTDFPVLPVRVQTHERLVASHPPDLLHLILLDDQRNHPHTGQLRAGLDRHVLRQSCDGHIIQPVDLIETALIHLEHPINRGLELDLPFFRFRCLHVRILAQLTQDLGCIILMQHRLIILPDIDVVLPDRKQHRDILFPDHMSLAEHGILRHPTDNLRDIMAEDLPYRIHRLHFLHQPSHPYRTYNKKTIPPQSVTEKG